MYTIRKVNSYEVKAALALVLEVFMQFEAPEYKPEGVATFKRDIIENENLIQNYQKGICPLYGAFDQEQIVGVMGMREGKTHINLAFVKKEYQSQGIGKALFQYVLQELAKEQTAPEEITLNASPYGKGFYLHLGFQAVSEEQEIDGIRFTPMKYQIHYDKNDDESSIVKANYDAAPEKEWERLDGFHFEFEITKHKMQPYLQKGSVLDIGGGPGRYSIYLAQQGYDVTLVDLSSGNVALAKKKAQEHGVTIKAYQCDARDLSSLKLGEFDNVLLMGPLYHLFAREDRARCVQEAKKHLKKGGSLFASFISIAAGLNYYLDECPEELIHEPAMDLFDRMEADETWSGTAFTEATFINNCEIEPFFEELGFQKQALFGQEGITGTRLSMLEQESEEVRNLYLNLSLRLCENPQYFCYSSHMMYIGKQQ